MKKLIPPSIRLKIKIIRRYLLDLMKGYHFKFSKKGDQKQRFPHQLSLIQPIKKTASSENKVINIKVACAQMRNVIIYPGEIFSFWQLVGQPNQHNGYKKGRNLIAGQLLADYGGGLCQLSGIIYYLSLKAGLEVIERFNHTVDIYTDETRYTPLGSDATVVYGYKDLRVKNQFGFPICFSFDIRDTSLQVNLLSTENIIEKSIVFNQQPSNTAIHVLTMDREDQIIAQSIYAVTSKHKI